MKKLQTCGLKQRFHIPLEFLWKLFLAARDEAMAASEAAREVDLEVKALRTMTHRMILTQEEMVRDIQILFSKYFRQPRLKEGFILISKDFYTLG
jgi:hypothetical protein